MNKRASSTAKAVAKSVVYPDILGAITNGKRLNINVLQVAGATRPPAINAGSPFEAVVLLQNAAATDIDAVIQLILPETDLAGQRGRFSTKMTRPVRIGLRPGEVGFTTLPVMITHQAMPGKDYMFRLEIQVEQKERNNNRVRDENGGTPITIDT